MGTTSIHLLLADDDKDDCLFFEEALAELPLSTTLVTVHDGEELMQHLTGKKKSFPHILFLDLNLPRKNGIECLSEIKFIKELKQLFVVIFSTSSEKNLVNLVYKNGAQYYIRKPAEFSQLKRVIHQALTLLSERLLAVNVGPEEQFQQPLKENFVLTGDLQ